MKRWPWSTTSDDNTIDTTNIADGTTSDNIVITTDNTTSGTITINGPHPYTPTVVTCSKCNKEKKVNEIRTSYNWGDSDKTIRRICKECHTEVMDKLFGLNRSVKTEKVLYGENE